MSPRHVALALSTTALLISGAFPTAPHELTAAGPNRTLESFSADRAMGHVKELAREIGVRVRATRGERRGAAYIADEFRTLGYNVRIQKFRVDGGTSRNVIASWPDARRYGVVIGGHMDSVPFSPGANDNASGVAVVLEIARLVAGKRQANLLRFVAFGAEEKGRNNEILVGSTNYVDRLPAKGVRRTAGMISIDMIADGRPLILGWAGLGPEIMPQMLFRKIDDADIAVVRRTMCACSDHGPFERTGIPAALLWSGDDPDYHTNTDTVVNISKADLLRTGRAVRAFVSSLRFETIKRLREH